ncbi:hypothetical protein BGI41_07530 [Methanobrevibacter sp. 87.7]|uniref:right-handed parallel beta-helix repeat-containing protein n=1 Tax=Methanobrevibacter sp. 87.7 TaxID=387957 RepID=UPI000B51060C|nr:hypothetical protein [Methanobrevibacter sp. 87.7]OWT32465.1 hypothetical protein BGI41_07530 [Methanobrevibacter sp. 87.7]
MNKKVKSLFLIFSLLIVLFSVNSVFASDVNNTDVNTLSDDNNILLNDNSSTVIMDSNSNSKSFTDLQNIVDSKNNNDVINLDSDYVYDPSTDSNTGVNINKNLTINGNGHVFNGMNKTSFFNITAPNVSLKLNNLKFINGYTNNRYAGIIYSNNLNTSLSVTNCDFDKNTGVNIYLNQKGNLYISNTNFSNIKLEVSANGNAIHASNNDITIINSTFSNLTGKSYAGAIMAVGDLSKQVNAKFVVKNTSFYNCYSPGEGGALYLVKMDCLIDNCTFLNCTSETKGGAISTNYDNLTIINSRFINNKIGKEKIGKVNYISTGGAINLKKSNCNIDNCTFNNNSAFYGSDLYFTGNDNNYNLTVNNSKFNKGNSAYGSCYILDKNNYYFNNSIFSNTDSLYFGSLVLGISNGTINNCSFINISSKIGGSIITNGNLTISNSTFNNGNSSKFDILKFISSNLTTINDTPIKVKNTNPIYQTEKGYINVSLEYGFNGFCSEDTMNYAGIGTEQNLVDTIYLVNKISREPVGDYLKILLYKYYFKINPKTM